MSDIGSTPSTAGSLAVGAYVSGDIETGGDSDWFAISLVAGQQYRFYLQGTQLNLGSTPGGTLDDPALQIRDAAGQLVAFTATQIGLNELIDFTAPATGTYHLAVSAGSAGATGTYTLSASSFVPVPEIAAYMTSGFWHSPITTNFHLEHHFTHDVVTVNISALGATEQALALAALNLFHEVSRLTFSVVTGAADITFSNGGSRIAEGGASAVVDGGIVSSTIKISSDWVTSGEFATQAFQIYMHEIGHALGIGHPGPYNGGDVRLGVNNLFANDSLQWTVMTYFGWPGQPLAGRVLTLQMADVYAVQQLYGVNSTTRNGDTVYGFNATAGGHYDLAAQTGAVVFTIYDTGGDDTLDVSGYAMDQRIDLHAGAFSSVGGVRDNIGIYLSTVVENAVGGSGADQISGNSVANRIFGRLGDDTIDGGEDGANFLRGEEGNDRLVGGMGFDDAHGNMGNDTVSGGAGDDWVVGGKDQDVLSGDDGDDIVYGNLGDDWCDGGAGNDIIRGGQATDTLWGRSGDDWLSGDRGDDTITGGSGADIFHTFSEAGLDRVLDFNSAEGDRVMLDPGTSYTVAQVGADVVIDMGPNGRMVLVGVQLSGLPNSWIFGA